MKKFVFLKSQLSFLLTLITIVGTLILAFFRPDLSLEVLLPTLLSIYVVPRTVQKTGAIIAASKDENCDTISVIKHLDPK